MITTREARLAAAAWVREQAEAIPEYIGALVAGSTRERGEGDPHPDSSDVDVWVIVDAPVPDTMLEPRHRFATRKFHHRGVVLERGFFPWERLADPERVLDDPYLAPNLAAPVILGDPSGRLRALAEVVAPAYARRAHVRRRVEAMLAVADRFCGWAATSGHEPPYHPAVIAPAQVVVAAKHAAGAVAVAALRQPTPRLSFVRAGEILAAHGRSDLYGDVLRALGSAELRRAEVERALEELARAYDVATRVRRTPFGMEHEFAPESRAFALGGVRELVDAGHHREAMYRLTLLRALAQNAVENDGSPAERAELGEGFRALLAAMGLDGEAHRLARIAEIRQLLPRLRAGCEEILAATPGIVDDR